MVAQYTPPEDYKSGLKEILGEAGKIYQQQKAAGYQTYQGPQIAGFAPEEQAAMRGIAGLVGTGQQYFNPATALTMGAARQFTPTEAATYMSPYQQAVVDVEKREASRYFPQQMQQIGAQAAGAGGYGGSRQAILEAETLRNQSQQLGDIQTRGSQRAFEQAQKAFGEQIGRERGAASGLMQLGQAVPQQAMTELSALAGVGEAQRGMSQAGLDIARQEYERQLNFPYEALGQYQSTVYQMPLQGFSRYQPVAKPSSAQNLAGVLGAAGSILGPSGFGVFKEGGHVAFRSQGGLSGMVNRLSEGATVGSEEDTTQQVASPKAALLESLLKMQTGLSDYQKQLEETSQEQQRLAEEKKARLEKQAGPAKYISDLLLGYASADPEKGMAGQIAEAAMYAGEQKQAVQGALDQIEADLASGKLTQAEAAIKLQQLQASSLGDIIEATGANTIDATTYNALARQSAARAGVTWNEQTQSYEGSAAQAQEAAQLLEDALSAFETGGFKGAQRTITIGPKVSDIGGGAGASESNDVTETETGKKADELIQGLE
jgi:hypothetical protein